MRGEIDIDKIYQHWISSSDNDYNTMIHLLYMTSKLADMSDFTIFRRMD
jgi:hypothetical protein